MPKKIAVINDLSGLGRCSLTVAISILSAMGVQACPLPTAILTAQTGYPSFYCDSYTDKMDYFRSEWEKLKVRFDGIYTGYVSDDAQIIKIFEFLDTFYRDNTFLLVDPVMGDDGKTYGMFNETLRLNMKKLVRKADYSTPNLTELCLLTDYAFDSLPPRDQPQQLFDSIVKMGESLCEKGTGAVVVTGIRFFDSSGRSQIGNMYITAKTHSITALPEQGASYSGTGDLFASVLTGGIARKDSLEYTIRQAEHFLQKALMDSAANQVEPNDGVNFEKYLLMLMPDQSIKKGQVS
ncbi:MAG: pyridoxamine kinase [Lachnospiraceae bacterium]